MKSNFQRTRTPGWPLQRTALAFTAPASSSVISPLADPVLHSAVAKRECRPLLLTRLLLLAVLCVLPLQSARSQVEANPFQTFGHTFDDLLDAVRTLRKKTNLAAHFWLAMPEYPTAPIFAPDGAGEAFLVLRVAQTFPEPLPAKELSEELARLRHSARFAPSYDATHRRLAYYPSSAVAKLRRSLAPWLITNEELAKLPFLRLTTEVVVARIPRDHEAEFLDALLTDFLHTNRKALKCGVDWN